VYDVALLPGDGIGPEVMAQAEKVLKAVSKIYNVEFNIIKMPAGGASIDECGVPLTEEVLESCRKSDAVLFGAVGGPKWDHLPMEVRPERAILKLRKELDLFANLRPAFLIPALSAKSPLKGEILEKGVDILVVRELTGGLYFGEPKGIEVRDGERVARDTLLYAEEQIRRVARIGFKLARSRRKRLCLVDKANVLASSRLWREVVSEVAEEFPDLELSYMYVDNCAMQLIANPGAFDVILTENTFGDILSDEAAAVIGSLGLMPSASLGEKGPCLYEPVHGSAPDIAGKNLANPVAMILSAAMMLDISFGLKEISEKVKEAVARALEAGYATPDVALPDSKIISCEEMGDVIISFIEK